MTTRASTMPALVDVLRDSDDEALVKLFRDRPDLLTPVPSDLDQLAARAGTRGSVLRALDRLDQFTLAVLETIVVLGNAPPAEILPPMVDAPAERITEALDRLRELFLVWGTPERLQVNQVLPETLGPYPAGLGPPADLAFAAYSSAERDALTAAVGADPAEALKAPERIDELLDEAGPDARALAARLAAGPPIGTVPPPGDGQVPEAVDRLRERGLLARVDQQTVVLPRQVGIRLRGGRVQRAEAITPPNPTATDRGAERVNQAAVGTALDVIRYVEQILTTWSSNPPPVLRSGGLGVRELRRAAALVEIDEQQAALLLECAYAAGLLGFDDDGWLPTQLFDGWVRSDPAVRWATLARAWFSTIRVPGLVGSRDERDRPRNVLSDELDRTSAPLVRRMALEALAEAGPGMAPSEDAVLARIRWRSPRRTGAFTTELVGWTLREAAALGVTGLGALAAPGRALVGGAGPDGTDGTEDVDGSGDTAGADVADALEPLLPAPVDHVLLQADLTAIAPGPLEPELARAMAQLAETESHGGATVYRFTPDSVRRALDQGRSATDLHQLLAQHSRTPVPQPLSYLIDDVARRHGQLRAGQASAYLRCDDETILSALIADQQAVPLQLRQIAPTVLVSTQPMRTLLDELRALGYAPVPETADGSLVLTMPERRRAPEPRRRSPIRSEHTEPDPELLAAGVRAVRAGDRARASRPEGVPTGRLPRNGSTEAVNALRSAMSQRRTVWLGYVDQHGGSSDRIVDPLRLDGGWLTAYDHAAGSSRSFALHRITGAVPVDPDAPS